MSDIFQIAAVGLLDGHRRLESIGTNAASASVTGYRRQIPGSRGFDIMAGHQAIDLTTASADTSRALVDLRAGGIRTTGRALDIAIESDDLFFALTDGRDTWLTRAGAFHLNESGVLVGERGLSVLGAQGEVSLPAADLEVGTDGRITHNGIVVGALQLFRPVNAASLRSAGGALLTAPDGFIPAEADSNRVRSGALEASNADPGREMLDLMALSRQFESLSRVVQNYDEALGRTLQKLGEM